MVKDRPPVSLKILNLGGASGLVAAKVFASLFCTALKRIGDLSSFALNILDLSKL